MGKATVTLADPDETIVIEEPDARDRRAAETAFARAVGAKPGTPMRTLLEAAPETYNAWTAWTAAVRQGATDCEWKVWRARCLDIDYEEEPAAAGEGEALPDPTDPATSTEPS